MIIYEIRIFLKKKKKVIRQVIKANDFNHACKRSRKSFASFIKYGHDVQIYNPGENHNLPQSSFKGLT